MRWTALRAALLFVAFIVTAGFTYPTAVKNNRQTQILNCIDAGAAAGKLEIGTTAMGSVLATITLADPAGSVASSALTFTMPRSDTSADNTGTAAAARVRDSDNNDCVTGLTVGTSGTDIIIDNTSINAGQTVTVNSFVITHP
jgi:hypothetical protein